jgi:DNA-binding Lrp family transcriptional regulator
MGRGLSQKQQRILTVLDGADQSGIVRIRDLRNRVGGSPQCLSRSVSRLEDRGLVERVTLQYGNRAMPAVRKKCADRNFAKKLVMEIKGIPPKTVPDGESVS